MSSGWFDPTEPVQYNIGYCTLYCTTQTKEVFHNNGQHMRFFLLNFMCGPISGQELELYFLPSDLMLSDLYIHNVHHCKQPSDSARRSKSLLINQDAPPMSNDIPWCFSFSAPSYPLWS